MGEKKKQLALLKNYGPVIIILLAGIASIIITISSVKQEMKNELLQKANITTKAINLSRLANLSGTAKDTLNKDYLRIKEQLIDMRLSHKNCQFLYLMQKNKKGQIVFLSDAQEPTSPDYAPPGLVYDEISQEYLDVFESRKSVTVGPIVDRWGRLVTALVPVIDKDNKLLAVLGMDVTINNWNQKILRRAFPVGLSFLITIILVFHMQQVRVLRKLKVAEAKIRHSKERYEALFFEAPDGIITGNLKGVLTEVNQSFCRITGYTPGDLIGNKIEMLFTDRVLENKPLDYNKVLAGETVRSERELLRKDGSKIIIEMYSKRISKDILQSFFRDITQRKKNILLIEEQNTKLLEIKEELDQKNQNLNEINKRLEEKTIALSKEKAKAEQSDRLKSAFLANMSHEIRTPMNAIIGFSELIINTKKLDENTAQLMEYILDQAEQLLKLINDIIDISKIEADHIQIYREQFNINSCLNDIYSGWVLNNKNEDVKIELEPGLDSNESFLYSDTTRIKQILNNLVGNALKFTKKGYVKIGYNPPKNNTIEFYVQDSGIGIDKTEQQEVFDRFRRLHDEHTSNYEGTGLGLAISKSLVELLGGEIRVESTLGKGSTFWFTLPFEQKMIEESNHTQQVSSLFEWEEKNILIVEDNIANKELLHQLLMPTKVKVQCCGTAKEAIGVLTTNQMFDLILLDIRLPDMSGLEVVKYLKKINSTIPVIAQTAYAMEEDKEKYKQAGCVDYIAKPIRAENLYEKIKKHI